MPKLSTPILQKDWYSFVCCLISTHWIPQTHTYAHQKMLCTSNMMILDNVYIEKITKFQGDMQLMTLHNWKDQCYPSMHCKIMPQMFNGLVQERRNSIANALELRLFCTNPPCSWCIVCNHFGGLKFARRCLMCHLLGWDMMCLSWMH